jgi:hypothetical protein
MEAFLQEKKRTAEKNGRSIRILGGPEGQRDGDVTAGTTPSEAGYSPLILLNICRDRVILATPTRLEEAQP